MPTVFIESERLWFRPPEMSDVELISGWINDPRIRKFLDSRVFPLNLESEREWIKNVTGSSAKAAKTEIVMLFGLKGASDPIGSAGLHAINWIVREAEWGILIGDPANWNQGYGREVAKRYLKYAFEELNLNRVQLRVSTANERGIKCYQDAGYKLEGTMRQAAYSDGSYDDMQMMAVLREEWSQ